MQLDLTVARAALDTLAVPGLTFIAHTKPVSAGGKAPPNIAHAFTSTDAAIEYINTLSDAQNIYFTPSLYKQGATSRKKANAAGARAIWVDVDVRVDTPDHYRTDAAALAGIQQFITQSGFPTPTIVYTGGGFHVYWLCAELLTPARWGVCAKNLHTAVKSFGGGLASDTARITDIASLMRLPGSYNITRDAPTRFVQHGTVIPVDEFLRVFGSSDKLQAPSVPPSPIGVFDPTKRPAHLGGTAPTAPSVPPSPIGVFDPTKRPAHLGGTAPTAPSVPPKIPTLDLAAIQSRPREPSPSLVAATTPIESAAPKPTYAQLLTNCAMLRRYATEPAEVSEPEWKFALNAVMQTTDGYAAALEFSAGHPDYDEGATAIKAQAAAALDRPVLCATLRGVSKVPHLCDGCKVRTANASPIKGAVARVMPARKDGETTVSFAERAVDIASLIDCGDMDKVVDDDELGEVWDIILLDPATGNPNPNIKVPPPPRGFVYGNVTIGQPGVFALSDLTSPLLPDVLYIDRRVEAIDSVDNRTSYRVQHRDVHGRVFTRYLKAKDLEPRALRTWLLTEGIATSVSEELITFLSACAESARISRKRAPILTVSAYGWHDIGGIQAFVTPAKSVMADGSRADVLVTGTDGSRTEPDKASFAAWNSAYLKMYGTHSHYAAWSVLASLASALFFPCQSDGSGVQSMTLVLSGHTGTGKSYLAGLCQSVWHKPRYVNGNSTFAAIPKEAARARHLPLVVDDLTINMRDKDQMRQWFLFQSSGQERSRATNTNVLDNVGTWRSLIIVTTNMDIGAVMSASDYGAGASARMLDISLTHNERVNDEATLNAARDGMLSNCGVVGRVFAERILALGIKKLSDAVKDADALITQVLRDQGVEVSKLAENRMRRRLVAMTYVVADIMRDMLPFDCVGAINWAVQSLYAGEFSSGVYSANALADMKLTSRRILHTVIAKSAGRLLTMIACSDVTRGHIHMAGVTLKATPAGVSFPVERGLQTASVEEWVSFNNDNALRRGVTPQVLHVVDMAGETVGFYIAVDFLNDSELASKMAVKTLAASLGECPDGSPRIQSVKLPLYISSTRMTVKCMFVAPSEIEGL